jgi:hypothetical protein
MFCVRRVERGKIFCWVDSGEIVKNGETFARYHKLYLSISGGEGAEAGRSFGKHLYMCTFYNCKMQK